jgi:hypothetical protein
MVEAGNMLLAEVMLWAMYIVLAIAVVTVMVSAVRSFFLDK